MKLNKAPAVNAPTSSAGLVRYFDISGGGLQITPELVLGVTLAFIAVEIALNFIV